MLSNRQKKFLDITLPIANIKKAISSLEEFRFKEILNDVGLEEGKDYIHQFPCTYEEAIIIVADFCLLKEKIIIELDGKSHNSKAQNKLDKKRDTIFKANDYSVIRVKTPLTDEKMVYWHAFIKEIVRAE